MKIINKLFPCLVACWLWTTPLISQTMPKAELTVLLQRALELYQKNQYKAALELYLKAAANIDDKQSEEERQAAVLCQIKASSCYYMTQQYEEGYQLAKQLLSNPCTAEEQRIVGYYYVLNGYMLACDMIKLDKNGNASYAKGRALLQEIAPYADSELQQYICPKIPLTWYFEGASHFNSLRFDEALICFENAWKGFQEIGRTVDAISACKQVASIKYHTYHLDEAIKNYEQALEMSQKINNLPLQMEIATELHRLSNEIGNMEANAKYANLMDAIISETTDEKIRFDFYSKKGKDALNQHDYDLAEQWFMRCREIAENENANSQSANKYIAYVLLRDLYIAKNQYDHALQYAKLVLNESKIVNKPSDKSYYLTYTSIARIYASKGDRANCLRSLDSLFRYEPYIEEPRYRSQLYTVRAACMNALKDYKSAFADYLNADEILASKYSSSNGERVQIYALLGGTAHQLKQHNEAEHYYELYAEGVRNIYGANSLPFINAQIYLANAQGFAEHIAKGCNNYTEAVVKLKELIRKRLPYMNSAEREGFWEPLSELLTRMTPYALKARLYNTEYTQTCYDALLLSKAFLLDSERSIYNILQKEGDEWDKQTYAQIATIHQQIKQWERDYTQHADSLLSAWSNMNQLENKLMKKCKSIGDITAFMEVDYESVKASLGKKEVLVDFTDFVSEKEGRRYAAYLVQHKQQYPLLIPLFAESQIDSLGIVRPDMFYDPDIASDIIQLIWNPIKAQIKEGATVYYVPSQLLFQICLESLPLEDGSLLGDHYRFVRLSSARELVKRTPTAKSESASAVLYGGLQFDMEPAQLVEHAKQYQLPAYLATRGGRALRGDTAFQALPESKAEVEQIANILRQSKQRVTLYTDMDGTVESFLNLHGRSPRILHLATHGFYFTPKAASEIDYLKGYNDAMLLSGLILAGGNASWQGKELPEGVLGGVLTAHQIARMDLRATELVVLSACQSGQGNATSEGLYGLQRAFKKAGVDTIVMTLWNVSDQATKEFMIKFYEAWMEPACSKRQAFQKAQAQIRQQYPDPYYWAAFVMLD